MTAGQDVLDIGTGTGLLAMLAAQHASKPCPGKSTSLLLVLYKQVKGTCNDLHLQQRLRTGSDKLLL